MKYVLLLTLLMGTPLHATEQWFLMARHGECARIDTLKRKVPDLGTISDPQSFADQMRNSGHPATVTAQPVPKGAAYEVMVPSKGLFLVFVTANLCSEFNAR